MQDMDKNNRDEYLKQLGLFRDKPALPYDIRNRSERRKNNIGSPIGYERRLGERRKDRLAIMQERYAEMVGEEKKLFAQEGIEVTTEQLMVDAGAGSAVIAADGGYNCASGDQLRALLPTRVWLPLSIHLIGLEDGALSVASLENITLRQEENLKAAAIRAGFKVEKLAVELWDRAELLKVLYRQQDFSAESSDKTLESWLINIDDGTLLHHFQRSLLAEATQLRATGIHLVYDRSSEAPNWIKLRIDGDLVPLHLLPADAMVRLTTLFKVDAGISFADRSALQQGRFVFSWQGRSIEVGVAAGRQAQGGEKLTVRLLDRLHLKSFDQLFSFYPDEREAIAEVLANGGKGNGGLFLISGLTGSGKSTTLHACVEEIDRRRRHVLSIENSIEYEIRYTTQWQLGRTVKDEGTVSEWANLIRSAMHHDPDYIVIGELPDSAAVETALQAAAAGYTVIAVINADSTMQALERVRSFIAAENKQASLYTLAQQLRLVLNQKLVKTLCPVCKIKTPAIEVLEMDEIAELEINHDAEVCSHNATGCELCGGSGFLGRSLQLETLLVETPAVKRQALYHALQTSVSNIKDSEGVFFSSHRNALYSLAAEGLLDPESVLDSDG